MPARIALGVLALAGLVVIAAGARDDDPKSPYIKDVPHIRQKPDFCGEACAAMWLAKLGHDVDQDWVFDQSGLDPREGRGCYTAELNNALKAIGFRTGDVWHRVPADDARPALQMLFDDMVADLDRGVPSIICMHDSDRPGSTEHFRLILGYDRKTDEVIYHEPAEADGAYRRMKRSLLLKLWPLKYDAKRWTVIRMPLASSRLRVSKTSSAFTDADFAQHLRTLKRKVPDGFHIVIEPPFVVVGDESEAAVQRRSERTVRWAVKALKALYFKKDPDEILDIWLFKDKDSYRKHTKELFGHDPSTPFGYYSPAAGALIMNISTGGGTLVHEIVHPFVRANFPKCPAWFNEGLGSLYEQCGQRDGKIVGFTNWRLAGLQKAIKRGDALPIDDLLAKSDREFYGKGSGLHYAQARYLCYYLQQRGLLESFYHDFAEDHRDDPTGVKTLKATLKVDDLKRFDRTWQAFVLRLRYP